VDLNSPNRKTPAGPAIAFLKKFGLRIANDNPTLLSRIGMDMVRKISNKVYSKKKLLLVELQRYHVNLSIDLSYNRCLAYDGLPNSQFAYCLPPPAPQACSSFLTLQVREGAPQGKGGGTCFRGVGWVRLG